MQADSHTKFREADILCRVLSRENISIHIYYMDSWGEMGNRLAAYTLGDVIAVSIPTATVKLFSIEHSCPVLHTTGNRIRELTVESQSPAERTERYLRLFDELESTHFPDGFEIGSIPDLLAKDITSLSGQLSTNKADIVIGTKGVISRLLVAAAGRINLKQTVVVNHVTNGGLLCLAVHKCPFASAHLVPFERDRTLLIASHRFEPNRITTIGPLVHDRRLQESFCDGQTPSDFHDMLEGCPGPVVLIFANRDGPSYIDLVRYIAANRPTCAVIFIALNDPSTLSIVREIAAEHGLTNWSQYSALPQTDFLNILNTVSRASVGFMVCKSGPNTVLEAVKLGLPCVVVSSGLPMERWVLDFVEENEIGVACLTGEQLNQSVASLLDDAERVGTCRSRMQSLARELFDSKRSQRALRSAIGNVMLEVTSMRPNVTMPNCEGKCV